MGHFLYLLNAMSSCQTTAGPGSLCTSSKQIRSSKLNAFQVEMKELTGANTDLEIDSGMPIASAVSTAPQSASPASSWTL